MPEVNAADIKNREYKKWFLSKVEGGDCYKNHKICLMFCHEI